MGRTRAKKKKGKKKVSTKPTRRQIVYRKRVISRKPKTRRIPIVSRKDQPQIVAEVRRLHEGDIGGSVSSSWIAGLAWDISRKRALMSLLNGYFYDVFIPFEVFEEWYYAHSKGTFFNWNVKGKFKVVRTL